MDDYSFAWTSAAGFIADFCAGGKITKRVPAAEHDRLLVLCAAAALAHDVDGYFWVVGGTGTDPAFKAFEQAHGTLKARQHSGTSSSGSLTGASVVWKLRGRVHRRLRYRSRAEDGPCGEVPRRHEEVLPEDPG